MASIHNALDLWATIPRGENGDAYRGGGRDPMMVALVVFNVGAVVAGRKWIVRAIGAAH